MTDELDRLLDDLGGQRQAQRGAQDQVDHLLEQGEQIPQMATGGEDQQIQLIPGEDLPVGMRRPTTLAIGRWSVARCPGSDPASA